MKNIKINVDYFKKAAMFMAGFSLFQCLRIALTASSFALRRFKIPVKNVDIFITKIHNSMEVAIFTGILITTLYVVLIPRKYSKYNSLISIFTNWLVCMLFFVVLVAYGGSRQMGNLTTYYWGLVFSGFAMGMNQSIVMAVSVENISYFAGSIPFAGVQVSVYHLLFLYYNKGRANYDIDYWILVYQIMMAIGISGIAAILWTIGFIEDHKSVIKQEASEVKLLNHEEVKVKVVDSKECSDDIESSDERIESQSSKLSEIRSDKLPIKLADVEAGESRHNIEIGKRGLKNLIKRSTKFLQINYNNRYRRSAKKSTKNSKPFSILLFLKGITKAISPIMMSTVAMGFVYLVFPAIAPYRLTNLETAHKIDISILITFVAPALINIVLCGFKIGPNCDWSENRIWHWAWIFIIPYFICIVIFFIPAHYPESAFSKLLTTSKYLLGLVCFMFSLSHAILKTVGFTGAGVQNTVKPRVITNTDIIIPNMSIKTNSQQKNKKCSHNIKFEEYDNSLNGQVSSFNILLSYLILVIFAFISDGYLKTVKIYEVNRDLWPTNNMGYFQSLSFWISRSVKRGLISFTEVFTLDVREKLMK